jgi:DNA-binding response OmpR family regulator
VGGQLAGQVNLNVTKPLQTSLKFMHSGEFIGTTKPSEPTLPFRGGVADLTRREVRYHAGDACRLSERETDLLRYLASNSGRTITRDELLSHVWHLNPARILTRTVDMHISNLRKKLRDRAEEPTVLFTVLGEGYVFAPNGRSREQRNAA